MKHRANVAEVLPARAWLAATCRRFLLVVLVATGALAVPPGGAGAAPSSFSPGARTTPAFDQIYVYDTAPVACLDSHHRRSEANEDRLGVERESAEARAEVRSTSTTLTVTLVATKAACSFSGDTDVLMADGTRKRIDEVEVGDMVVATDPTTGETKAREVVATLPHTDQLVTLETSAGEIVTTEDHRYWNLTDSEWQAAQDLDPGDRLLTASGTAVVVEGLDWTMHHTAVAYDLDVQGIDTFYVGAGESAVLVHNCNILPKPVVSDPKLQNYVDNLYKGTTNPGELAPARLPMP